MKPIDIHVHIVGNGADGTGCRLQAGFLHRLLGRFMLHHIGLPQNAMDGDLDRLYVQRLLELVRESSLGSAVILAQDDVYDEQGRRMEDFGTFYVPNEYVLELARRHKEFLPGVSIHPSRLDAMEELDRCLAGGAVLLKILPNAHGIDCNDRRFTKFWERLAEARLPLLAHTGGEHSVRVLRSDLQTPRVLDWPLQCGVTCIAAHSGGKGGLFDRDYFDVFADMTRRHANLYGDISSFNIPARMRNIPAALQAPVVDRLLHGSDFPVLVYGHWAWMHGLVDWKTFRRWERQSNPLERDYQLKVAMGFPPAVFTRAAEILRGVPGT